jgi:hypothetical protein
MTGASHRLELTSVGHQTILVCAAQAHNPKTTLVPHDDNPLDEPHRRPQRETGRWAEGNGHRAADRAPPLAATSTEPRSAHEASAGGNKASPPHDTQDFLSAHL